MNQAYRFKPSLFQHKKNSFEYEQSLQKVIRFQIIPRLLSSHSKVCSRHVENGYQSGLKITGFEISEFIKLCIADDDQLSKDYIKRLISYGISTDQIFLELITPAARERKSTRLNSSH